MVQKHIADNGIEPGQLIFPVRLFTTTMVSRRQRMSPQEMAALGWDRPDADGRHVPSGTRDATARVPPRGLPSMGPPITGVTASDERTGRTEREWSADRRRDPTEYVGDNTWGRIWNRRSRKRTCRSVTPLTRSAIPTLPWLIDKGVDIEKVRHRLGHGDLTTTTRYVKILDEEDSSGGRRHERPARRPRVADQARAGVEAKGATVTVGSAGRGLTRRRSPGHRLPAARSTSDLTRSWWRRCLPLVLRDYGPG